MVCALSYLFFSRMNFGINQNNSKMIDKLYLMENGSEVEVHTFEKVFTVDIKNIRKLEIEEGLFLAKNINTMQKNYIPISINQQLYLIPKICKNNNKDILNAISNGKYIKIDEKLKEEESIDVSEYADNNSFIDIDSAEPENKQSTINKSKKI